MSDLSIPFREYFERLQDERWHTHGEQHRAEAIAVEKTASGMDRRLDSMNELRTTLAETVNRTVSRDVFDAEMDKRDIEIQALKEFRAKAGLIATGIGLTAGTFGAIVGLIVAKVIK